MWRSTSVIEHINLEGDSGALFSGDRVHRYVLWRKIGDGDRPFIVIGLNPSTADETKDDPTIRRCMQFGRREGCGRFIMLNLFAYRATDPDDMKSVHDPVGPCNDTAIIAHCTPTYVYKPLVMAAWGVHGGYRMRHSVMVARLLDEQIAVHVLGFTTEGYPKHPLYVRADTPLMRWL
jgi:hypothetical protein